MPRGRMSAITNGTSPTQASPSYVSTVRPSGSICWTSSGATGQCTNASVSHAVRSSGTATCCSAVRLTTARLLGRWSTDGQSAGDGTGLHFWNMFV